MRTRLAGESNWTVLCRQGPCVPHVSEAPQDRSAILQEPVRLANPLAVRRSLLCPMMSWSSRLPMDRERAIGYHERDVPRHPPQ